MKNKLGVGGPVVRNMFAPFPRKRARESLAVLVDNPPRLDLDDLDLGLGLDKLPCLATVIRSLNQK